jgi:prevent-host-death family protein
MPMREIGSFEAKNKLSALLDQVEHGAEIVITRHGKAVAKLVPAEPGFDRDRARRAAAGLREASKGVTLRGLKIKDLIGEGRR